MLTLAIGDLYVPDRAIAIPEKFRKLLAPNPQAIPSNSKISQVLCLGNITNSFEHLEFLHNVSPNFHLVKGEFDDPNILAQELSQIEESLEVKDIPSYKVVRHDNLKIGFTNGYQVVPKNDPLSLLALARELDVDVLIWGGTHVVEAYILDGKFFVNPGSATGAPSFDWPEKEEEEDEEEAAEEAAEEKAVEEETAAVKEGAEAVVGEDSAVGGGEEGDSEVKEDSEAKGDSEAKEEAQKDGDKEATKEESSEEITADDVAGLETVPSFCLLETHDLTCTLYIYTYVGSEVKVDKVTYHKE